MEILLLIITLVFNLQAAQSVCVTVSNCDDCPGVTSCTNCSYHYYLQAGTCRLCHESCGDCTGNSFRDCIDCSDPNGYFDTDSDECQCNPTFNNLGSGQIDDCQCPSNSSESGGVCLCDVTWYDSNPDPNVVACIQCEANCDECSSTTVCTKCSATYFLLSDDCYQPCPNGTYGDSTTIPPSCQPCVEPCATCDGGTLNDCLTCNGANTQLAGASPNTCECISTFINIDTSPKVDCDCPSNSTDISGECICDVTYADTDLSAGSVTCTKCTANCDTCLTTDVSQCTLCSASFFIHQSDGSCVNPCDPGYWGDTTAPAQCKPCVEPCATCDGGTLNDCLTCNGANTQLAGASPNTCECISTFINIDTSPKVDCDCPSNSTDISGECICDVTYADTDLSAGSVTCTKCTANCDTCLTTDVSQCTLCSASFFLHQSDGSCVNPCDPGYWGDATAPAQCKPCVEPCATCDGGTLNDCLTCNGANTQLAGASPNTCECISTFINIDTSPKVDCDCPSNSTDISGECICDVTYADTDLSAGSVTCTKCTANCDTCLTTDVSQCTLCSASFFLHQSDGSCMNPCDPGYWGDTTAPAQCKPCVEPCATCDGGTLNDCLTCNGANTQLAGASPNTCECISTFINIDTSPKVDCDCPSNSTDISGECICDVTYADTDLSAGSVTCTKCTANCDTCLTTDVSQCTLCSASFFLHQSDGSCVNPCDPGYYGDTTAPASCQLCVEPCATCNGGTSNDCYTCNGGNTELAGLSPHTCKCLNTFVNIDTSPRVDCDCPSNSTDISGECICDVTFVDTNPSIVAVTCTPCTPNCDICSNANPNICFQCSAGFFLHQSNGTCVNPCDNGFFGNTSLTPPQCDLCVEPCKTCDGGTKNNCLTCNGSNTKLASGPSSTCICIDTYQNSATLPKVDCSCPVNSTPVLGDCICNPGYYDNDLGTGVSCYKCLTNCATCTNQNDCTKCMPGYAILSSTIPMQCVSDCPEGYFMQTTPVAECKPCFQECKRCVGELDNECTECWDTVAYIPSSIGKCTCKEPFEPPTTPIYHQSCICPDPSYRVGDICECNDGYYNDSKNWNEINCVQCPDYCLGRNCFLDTSEELICYCPGDQVFHVESKTCVDSCPDGMWKNYSTKKCEICSFPCATCKDSTYKQCSSCVDEFMDLLSDFTCQCKDTFVFLESKCQCPDNSTQIKDICKCDEGYYSFYLGISMQCGECPDYCLECYELRSDLKCKRCIDQYYDNDDGVCEKLKLYLSIEKTDDNEIYITLQNLTWKELEHNNLKLVINGIPITEFTVQIVSSTPKDDTTGVVKEDKYIIFTDIFPISGKIEIEIIEVESEDKVYATYYADPEDESNEDDNDDEIELAVMILIQILTACWFGYALYTWNLSGFWYFLTNIQLIGFIPMTAVNFPRLGTLILRNMLNYIFIPNVFKWFISKDTHEFNKFTLRNGFESSLIILNVGCLLIAFILLLLVYPVLKMDKDLPFFAKMLNEYKWNALIRFQLLATLQFFILGLLQLLEESLEIEIVIFNYVLAVFITLSCVLFPITLIYIYDKTLKTYKEAMSSKNCKNPFPKINTIYYEFTVKKKMIQLLFFGWFLVKRTLHTLNWVFNYNNGTVQAVINMVLATINLWYIFNFQPHKKVYRSQFMGAIEITMIIFFAIPLLAEYVTDDAAINAFVIICLVLIIIFHLTYYIQTERFLSRKTSKRMNSIIPQQQPPEFRSFVVPDLAMPPSILNMQNSRELNSITFNKGEKVYTKKENSDDEDMAATERPSSFFNSTAATRR